MLGSTVPARNGIFNCFEYGDLWGCDSIQIYSTLSRRWNIPEFPEEDIVCKFKAAYRKSNVKMVVSHIPFLVNLCAADLSLQKKSADRLRTELLYNNRFDIPYTVLHPGSHPNKFEAIQNIAKNINKVLQDLDFENQCTILLETMSGQGNYLGSIEDIANIISLITEKDRIGVCLDTAHLYQNGYDLNKDYNNTINMIDKTIGLHYVKAIHINDSLTKFKSHVDRHAFIGEGYINLHVFKKIVNDSAFIKIPKILELPDISRAQEALQILQSLRYS